MRPTGHQLLRGQKAEKQVNLINFSMGNSQLQIRQSGLNLRAMYRTACLMSHDCTPNTKHTFRTGRATELNKSEGVGRVGLGRAFQHELTE